MPTAPADNANEKNIRRGAMKLPESLDRVWRGIESFHTLIWIFPSLGAVGLSLLGYFQNVPLFYVIAWTLTAWAAAIFIIEKLYWRFGYCPMPQAAQKAYDSLKNLGVGAFAKGFDKSGMQVLDSVASALAQEMPVYGCEPPSTQLEQLPERLFSRGNFCNEGKTFFEFDEEHPEFVGICVRRIDLARGIRAIKKRITYK